VSRPHGSRGPPPRWSPLSSSGEVPNPRVRTAGQPPEPPVKHGGSRFCTPSPRPCGTSAPPPPINEVPARRRAHDRGPPAPAQKRVNRPARDSTARTPAAPVNPPSTETGGPQPRVQPPVGDSAIDSLGRFVEPTPSCRPAAVEHRAPRVADSPRHAGRSCRPVHAEVGTFCMVMRTHLATSDGPGPGAQWASDSRAVPARRRHRSPTVGQPGSPLGPARCSCAVRYRPDGAADPTPGAIRNRQTRKPSRSTATRPRLAAASSHPGCACRRPGPAHQPGSLALACLVPPVPADRAHPRSSLYRCSLTESAPWTPSSINAVAFRWCASAISRPYAAPSPRTGGLQR